MRVNGMEDVRKKEKECASQHTYEDKNREGERENERVDAIYAI